MLDELIEAQLRKLLKMALEVSAASLMSFGEVRLGQQQRRCAGGNGMERVRGTIGWGIEVWAQPRDEALRGRKACGQRR